MEFFIYLVNVSIVIYTIAIDMSEERKIKWYTSDGKPVYESRGTWWRSDTRR